MPSPRLVVVVLVVVGILALAAGLIYLSVPAHSLPGFVPGHMAGSNYHHNKRGIAGLVLGIIFLVIAVVYGTGGRSAKA